jgi:CheY-like chemotaxis protein
MTPFDLRHETDALAFFTRVPEPSGLRACMVVIADRQTRFAVADHLEHLGYEVWTASSGLDAYRLCLEFHENVDVLVCDENLPDLPPLVLFSRLKTQLPGLQCCVVASVRHRPPDESVWRESVVLDVIGWRAGMLFVSAVVSDRVSGR